MTDVELLQAARLLAWDVTRFGKEGDAHWKIRAGRTAFVQLRKSPYAHNRRDRSPIDGGPTFQLITQAGAITVVQDRHLESYAMAAGPKPYVGC